MSIQQFGSSVPDRYTVADVVHREPVGEVLGEVVRVAGRRRHRVERRPAGDAVVAVVEVAVAEEHRGRVGAQHDLGRSSRITRTIAARSVLVVGQLAVGVVEVEVAGEAEQRRRLGRLLAPAAPRARRGRRRDPGVPLSPRVVMSTHTSLPAVGPPRQRAAGRDLGIVGVGVDGQGARRDLVGRDHDCRAVRGQATQPRIPSSAATARASPASSTSWWVTNRTVSTSMVPAEHARRPPSRSSRSAGSAAARAHTMLVSTAAGSTLPGKQLRQRVGELAGAGVVVGQTLDHRLQRHDAGRGDHARLAHPAARGATA